jgi:N6-adenosine-specific RNA methylase IME4
MKQKEDAFCRTTACLNYDIIYADPPWQFSNKNTGGNLKSGACAKYPTMPLNDICNLPIKNITANDCILFMWWVASMPEEALEVVKSWGFTIKTMTGFTWVKKTKNGKLFFGMGFWTRQGVENCLIAVKGKPKRINAAVRSVIECEIEKHSKKPDVVRSKITELMGDKLRLELFARQKSDGWDVWGNEIKNDIIL